MDHGGGGVEDEGNRGSRDDEAKLNHLKQASPPPAQDHGNDYANAAEEEEEVEEEMVHLRSDDDVERDLRRAAAAAVEGSSAKSSSAMRSRNDPMDVQYLYRAPDPRMHIELSSDPIRRLKMSGHTKVPSSASFEMSDFVSGGGAAGGGGATPVMASQHPHHAFSEMLPYENYQQQQQLLHQQQQLYYQQQQRQPIHYHITVPQQPPPLYYQHPNNNSGFYPPAYTHGRSQSISAREEAAAAYPMGIIGNNHNNHNHSNITNISNNNIMANNNVGTNVSSMANIFPGRVRNAAGTVTAYFSREEPLHDQNSRFMLVDGDQPENTYYFSTLADAIAEIKPNLTLHAESEDAIKPFWLDIHDITPDDVRLLETGLNSILSLSTFPYFYLIYLLYFYLLSFFSASFSPSHPLISELKVHTLTAEDILEPDPREKTESFDKYRCVVLHESYFDFSFYEAVPFILLIYSSYIITIRLVMFLYQGYRTLH